MSKSVDPQPRAIPAPEEMPWSISYLHDDIQALRTQSHDDIQALRTEIGIVHNRIDETNCLLNDAIKETNRDLGNRIDETNRLLNDSIKETSRDLGNRIDETNKRIDETNRDLSEQIRAVHKRMDTYFLWMMGTLVTITGVLVAVIKL